MNKPQIEKFETGIKMLDRSLDGGIPKNHLILVTGSAGTFKSSLAFQFAYENVAQGKKAIYVTLEQNAVSIITQMMTMNFDFDKIRLDTNNTEALNLLPKSSKNKKGMLTILDIGYIRANRKKIKNFQNFYWLEEIKKQLTKHSKREKPDIIILDSLTALYHLEIFKDVRIKLFHIFGYLKELNATSLVINEMPPGDERYSQYGVESYLVDGVILLSLKRRGLKVNREISIVKMRYVDHDTNIFVLKFDKSDGKFKMFEKLQVEEDE